MTLFPFSPMFEQNYVPFNNRESTYELNKTVSVIEDLFKKRKRAKRKKKRKEKRSSILNFQLNKLYEYMGLH